MAAKNWQEIKATFHEALRHNTGVERDKFLDEACAGDIEFRIEVESLLISLVEAKNFLELPIKPEVAEPTGVWQLKNGQAISHYRIISPIASGGMGEVYLAEDEQLGRQAAIKVLPEDLLENPERLRRFQREAQLVSALNHPNILTVFEFGAGEEIHFLASEFVKGETLRVRLERGKLDLRDALDIALQIGSALNAAHETGVVHRDIKPENVMIRDDGYVKVLDFGLAKLTEKQASDPNAATKKFLSRPGMIMGTATYMSPEQARSARIDGRSDIFSLGIVLYEMLTGSVPFAGETATDVIAAIIQLDAPAVTSIEPGVPSELDAIVSRCLSKAAADRYRTAGDLIAELKSVLKRLELDAELARTGRPVTGDPLLLQGASRSDSVVDERNALIGRENEIADVAGLLRRDDVRLVTLTGIGGAGKTRLAKAVADRLAGEFPSGTAFVELSCVRDPELVASSIAESLGIPEIGSDGVLETIKGQLRDKPVLLVLDNFEQVIASATQIAELIEDLPGSKVVATSRELLHLSIEVEYAVPPLAVPSGDTTLTADEARRFESIVLFEKRARSASPEFAVTDENAADIAEICARLDGLPLAIELAAARAKILSPAEILAKLDDRLSLLTGGAKDLPDRQRTVRGAIEWSYDLLTETEKDVFRRLSVFAGGFTNSAAEAVLLRSGFAAADDKSRGTETIAGDESIGLLDLITSLADKSLIVSRRGQTGERRFRMLDTVREYGVAVLAAADGAQAVHRSHSEYFLELAETAEPNLKGANSATWLRHLEVELDNIRAVLKWTIENAPDAAARLAAAIRHLWTIKGHLHEGRRWSAAILSGKAEMSDDVRWKILTCHGNLSQFHGDVEKAQAMYKESLAVSTRSGDRKQISQSLRGLAALDYMNGDFASARELIEKAVALSRETEDEFGLAASLARLGDIASAEGDFASAYTLSSEALFIYRKLGYKEGISAKLNNIGAAAFGLGEHDEARACFDEALTNAIELDERINTRLIFDGFAALAAERGQLQRAAELSGVAQSLGASIGYTTEPAELRFRDSYILKLRAALGEEAFDAAHKTGFRLTLDEAVKLARDEPPAGTMETERHSAPSAADEVPRRPFSIPWPAAVAAALIAAGLIAVWFFFYRGSR